MKRSFPLPEANTDFKPAWFLRSAHLQTLWPVLFKRRMPAGLRFERLRLEDGDFLDLCWTGNAADKTVLVLHGLEGNIHSHYARGIVHRLQQAGFRAVFMHFRGCSGEPNRLPRAYHSGETGDLCRVVEHIRTSTGNYPYAAIGYSLGGNVLLKWLGETGADNPLTKAAAVSVPFQLAHAGQRLEKGWSRLYRDFLLRSLRKTYRTKFSRMPSPLDVDLRQLKSFRDYDDRVTAPLHGFRGADDYYRQCSCQPYLKKIRVPTRLIHALDDPFMFPHTVPEPPELSLAIDFQLTRQGGHVGFVSGSTPWTLRSWSEERVIEFLHEEH